MLNLFKTGLTLTALAALSLTTAHPAAAGITLTGTLSHSSVAPTPGTSDIYNLNVAPGK